MNEQDIKSDANRAFTWGRGKLLGLSAAGVVIAALVIAFLLKGCGGPDKPKIDPKTQKSIDSLNTTKPQFEKQKDSVIKIVVHDTVTSTRLVKEKNQLQARAQQAESRAEALAAEAASAKTAQDSATKYHAAYDEEHRANDTLTKALVKSDSSYKAEHDARINLSVLYGADTLRRIATEHVNEGLQRDISKLQQPCTVPGTFGKIPCPSRTVTLVLTAAAVEGIHLAQKAAKP